MKTSELKNEKNDGVYLPVSFFSKSPALILFSIAFTVFSAEAGVMLLLHFFTPESWLSEAFLDATLLVIFISPALYIFLFRPMLIQINERRSMEEALHKNKEEQFKIMIRGSLDGFWMSDLRGRFLEVNDAYCQMIGYSRNELLKMDVTEVEAKESPEVTEQHIRKLLDTGKDYFETHHRHKDGRILVIEISANYSPHHSGRIYSFLRDVTERKRGVDSLRESEERYRSLFENMLDGYAYCRMLYENGIPFDFIYLQVNRQF